jgi:hypothetical protein
MGWWRTVVYLQCSDNNFSETVLHLFLGAVAKYGWPYRLRGDRGGENVLAARAMIAERGLGRQSYIAGPSRVNTRIERLWRDVMTQVIEAYRRRFRQYEELGLRVDDAVHMFALHYMYLPLINADLAAFTAGWNSHRLSTERNLTPHMLMLAHADKMPPPAQVEVEYGLEMAFEDALALGADVDAVPVYVDPVVCPLDDNGVEELRLRCAPLQLGEHVEQYDARYMQCLQIVREIVQR